MHIEFDSETEIIDDIYYLASALEDIITYTLPEVESKALTSVAAMLARGIQDGANELSG
ncbi:hypothetical protein [Maridesulfovibrio sp.]|uniref:hypothetical protein n=1 Tax=Maridesulfovibrio sp. TaxID=2795000 RepID=UPI002AA8D3D7|nr:hypothetical protein [Maridesulfovibrio sp.]